MHSLIPFISGLDRRQRDQGLLGRDGDANESGLLDLRELEPKSGPGILADGSTVLLQYQDLSGCQASTFY